jgi:hypothetical protein
VLLLGPSDRQSGALAAKVLGYYGALGQPVGSRKRTEQQLHLVNGGRVIALPKNEKTIRGDGDLVRSGSVYQLFGHGSSFPRSSAMACG